MISSHVKNDFWDIDFSPLYNTEAACEFNGEPDVSYPWYKPHKKITMIKVSKFIILSFLLIHFFSHFPRKDLI